MRFTTTILLPFLLQTTTTIAAPAVQPGEALVSRDLKLPTDYGKTCRTTQLDGKLTDVTDNLRTGLNDVRLLVLGAMKVGPTEFDNWFENWLPIEDYHLFLKLCASVNEFVLPQSEFGTIFVDCEAPPPACDSLKEPDHTSSRLAVTNPENNFIYTCFKLYDPDQGANLKALSDVGPSCPNEDDGVPSISNWQSLGTTLAREIAHTSALIRRMGPPFLFTDKELHAKIDRFGWMVTHAFFQDKCKYTIPIGDDRWEYKKDLANIEEVFQP